MNKGNKDGCSRYFDSSWAGDLTQTDLSTFSSWDMLFDDDALTAYRWVNASAGSTRHEGAFAIAMFVYGNGDARLCVGRSDGQEIETFADVTVPWGLFRDVVDQLVALLAVAAADDKLATVADVLLETAVELRTAEATR